jgi:galactose mutarotase-like enzyme
VPVYNNDPFATNPEATAMPQRTWILTDVDADIYQDHLSLGPDQVGGPAKGYSVVKRTLRGGLREGVDVVEVQNGRLRFVVVPTRGMGIWRASCDALQVGWKSPVKGPVHPVFVPVWEPSGIGWLSGFDELLARCGLESNGGPEFLPNGALRYPLHGKIANTPAQKVEVTIDGDKGEIAICGVVDETRLYGNKLRMTTTIRTRVGSCEMSVTDEIQNLSAEPGELELLYHINFGVPLLTPGAQVVLPVKKVAPREAVAAANMPEWNLYGPETPGLAEACLYFDLLADAAGQSRALLRSATGQQGVSVKFNRRELPCFTIWKNRQAAADGYVTGLEPGVNFPNAKSFEKKQGRVALLSPGETRRFEVTIEAHPDAASVAAAEKAVAAIQGTVKPEICTQPDPKWSAM